MINSGKYKERFDDERFDAISMKNERAELDRAESDYSLLIRANNKRNYYARVAEDAELLSICPLVMIGCVDVSEVRPAVDTM